MMTVWFLAHATLKVIGAREVRESGGCESGVQLTDVSHA